MSTEPQDPHFEICSLPLGSRYAQLVHPDGTLLIGWLATRAEAVRAIELICGAPVTTSPHAEHAEVRWAGNPERPTEVRDVTNDSDRTERNDR